MRSKEIAVKIGLFAVLVLSVGLAGLSLLAQTERTQANSDQQRIAWVAESLKAMQSVKPGMTRGDLYRVFTTEGGLSTGLQRTYVYRDCLYFKVNVVFDAVGRPARDRDGRVTLVESTADTIKTISTPYLQFSVMN
jgi:hypothetical protein